MNARIIFDKNFADKYKTKSLTNHEIGQLRYNKLEEAAKGGALQFAKKKNDVAKIGGFTGKQLLTSGYQWVKRLVDNGYLEEVPVGRDQYGLTEYQYTLTTKPYSPYRSKSSYKKPYKKAQKPTKSKAIKIEERVKKLSSLANLGMLDKPMHRNALGKLVAPDLRNASNRARVVKRLIEEGYLKETSIESNDYWGVVYKYELANLNATEKPEDKVEPAKVSEEPADVAEEPATLAEITESVDTAGNKYVVIKCGGAELELVGYTTEDIIALVKGLL